MTKILGTLVVLAALVGCDGEDTAAAVDELRQDNAALRARVETLETQARQQAQDLAVLAATLRSPVDAPPTPRPPMLSEDQRDRLHEVGIRMIEKMEANGTLDRAGELGVEALEELLSRSAQE